MKFFSIAMFLLLVTSASAQTAQSRTSNFNVAQNGLAIDGFDPVAYFKDNKAVKGKKDLAVSYNGLLYYFSTPENKETFKKSPATYEPQYGGWCAYAMGNSGEKVEVDPETFKVKNGKLYLFYNKYFTNTLKSWDKDENNLQANADKNWKKITGN